MGNGRSRTSQVGRLAAVPIGNMSSAFWQWTAGSLWVILVQLTCYVINCAHTELPC